MRVQDQTFVFDVFSLVHLMALGVNPELCVLGSSETVVNTTDVDIGWRQRVLL